MILPDLNTKIAIWRQKAVEGTLTREEMKEAILALRGSRVSAAAASEGARRKAAKTEVPSADDLLRELGEI
jgi:hypothetical protein